MWNCCAIQKSFSEESSAEEDGERKFDHAVHGEVATLVWCDKRPIYFVTIKYISDVHTTVQLYDAKEHKKVPVVCPATVKANNENMGGTDKNDQMSKLRRCRRHYRWPQTFYEVFLVGSLQRICDATLFLSAQSEWTTTQNISNVCQ